MSCITIVKCPVCSKKTTWNQCNKWRPFCSKRCQLIDLGEWLLKEKVNTSLMFNKN
ncbi:DNA gyrase inhibitor YacG [Candidatus Erwinia haradaeae]|uniref:DNA gyrase inhibitor YacG n=1 Tax=Candidatus Erwinia haradaeae TaxID=1922217 RepID=A0A451D4D9_9GAMM|nr:DNA gyrase inhibitor YacG [Candidatus Erwinia haradaeae]VFP80583.1 DNA gyrase inhibitor YacG [Candidatus Erwinia haradaeae]